MDGIGPIMSLVNIYKVARDRLANNRCDIPPRLAGVRVPNSSNMSLVTSERLDDLIIFNFMSYSPYMPNLGSLSHSHGQEKAPVVHRPGPGHLPEVG